MQSANKSNTSYNCTAVHFDTEFIPAMLEANLPPGPLTLADLGCGDGPLFSILERRGFISRSKSVYAVDLQLGRLERVRSRFPYIQTIVAAADEIPISDGTLDFVISTMVMEHVPDEVKFLNEIRRVLRPGGTAYITTVYKKSWAWYFRRRDGKPVLDTSHIREYTDLERFKQVVIESGGFSLRGLEIEPLRFPLIDPILFRLSAAAPHFVRSRIARFLRRIKVRIPGYFSLNVIVAR